MRAIRSNNSLSFLRRSNNAAGSRTRREFVKDIAGYGVAVLATGRLVDIVAAQAADFKNRIGLELYTDRAEVRYETPRSQPHW